jgi:hypothetical protein
MVGSFWMDMSGAVRDLGLLQRSLLISVFFFGKYHHLNFKLDLFGYSEWCLFGLWRLKDCY